MLNRFGKTALALLAVAFVGSLLLPGPAWAPWLAPSDDIKVGDRPIEVPRAWGNLVAVSGQGTATRLWFVNPVTGEIRSAACPLSCVVTRK